MNFKSEIILSFKKIYRISGKLVYVRNRLQIIHPIGVLDEKDFFYFDKFEPQYDLSRKKNQ